MSVAGRALKRFSALVAKPMHGAAQPDGIDLLISADERHVWVNLSKESALALANRLLAEFA